MQRLLRSTAPFADESLLGYLLRVSEINQYSGISWLLQLSGLPTVGKHVIPDILFSNLDLSRLAILTKCDVKLLISKTHIAQGVDAYNFFGSSVQKKAIHSLYPKICPSCLSETGYHKATWDFALTTCCPLHNSLLVNRCPACQKRISWLRTEMLKCKCGYNFSAHPITHIAQEEVLIANTVSLRLDSKTIASNSTNPLYELELNDLFFLINIFCRDFQKAEKSYDNPFFKKKGTDIKTVHDKIVIAKSIFDNWPANFYNFLEVTKFNPTTRKHAFGLTRKFGNFSDVITKLSVNFCFIKEAFNAFLNMHFFDGPIYRSKIIDPAVKFRRFMTKTEAVAYLNSSDRRIDKLIKNGTIAGRTMKVKTRHVYMLDGSSVESFKQSDEYMNSRRANNRNPGLPGGQGLLSFDKVAKHLSIGREKLISIINAKHIFPTPEYPKYYSQASIDELLEAIEKRIQISDRAYIQSLNFKKTCWRLAFLGIKAGDVITLIKNGILIPRFKTANNGLNAYHFFESEIKTLIKAQLDNKIDKCITVEEYARILHTDPDSIRFLIKRGFIKSYISGIKNIGMVLSSEFISDFESKYVFLREIIKRYGSSGAYIRKYLENAGVKPISGLNIDNGSAYVYLRKDLEGINIDIKIR